MAANDAITTAEQAQALIEKATAAGEKPALSSGDIALLVTMAASTNDDDATVYTVADLNRMASLGWQWKAGAASSQFKVGVGPGKSFELNQIYEHCTQMAASYASGQLSVIGSVDVDDGTGAPGRRASIGSIGITSVMNQGVS